MAVGLVLDEPGKRIGPNAITTLDGIATLGLRNGLLAADRAYTEQTHQHFAGPARERGYQIVLDYKRDNRGIQGSLHGAPFIDGNLACACTPAPLAHATTGLADKHIRKPDEQLLTLIEAREPYYLKLKQGPDARGAFRAQCPAAGTSPSVTCPRYERLHPQPQTTKPAVIDLTDQRQRNAHPATRPVVVVPAEELLRPPRPEHLPKVCRQTTITVHPDDLGTIAKYRQDLHYLTAPWASAYKAIRANNEGINSRVKGHHVNLADPKKPARARACRPDHPRRAHRLHREPAHPRQLGTDPHPTRPRPRHHQRATTGNIARDTASTRAATTS